ncbi:MULTISPECIES: nucleotidyltransferase family protein [unclassified Undibacterium]|uniref:nucleotidyltransferase family protein n=1 Tax=unclassified Undibacterium TaxID=2630295 RepID=UPI002AC91725|nr:MULTISPECIES: nucleotidyltransferase domain-containing protein [unclassified Undibacterium]MEB0138106.1 nucleotidyltransferase domain-containing protein [Undibacterium sp. CCC2.1]MEB0171139.1 nucleotidyltransferase domain-containing protein [Undibacterium sp. CCC1.1]MEB0175184.1 nucleotidyltransferase domain-containing protein [Undibacterium sp. CCC3.4]MEB0214232.1 nucleotidyltransferase domain-containing protein [Undibacterium sp. 5I2]WPX41814.1 nucleotidyltransferase domain-containing pro
MENHPLDLETVKTTQAFLAEAATKFPLRSAILYGNRARGEFKPDSDADLVVLLSSRHGQFLSAKMALSDKLHLFAETVCGPVACDQRLKTVNSRRRSSTTKWIVASDDGKASGRGLHPLPSRRSFVAHRPEEAVAKGFSVGIITPTGGRVVPACFWQESSDVRG